MKKSDLYGIIGSAIFCGLVILLLFLIYMPGNKTPEDEGIIVSFGNSFEGGGRGPSTSTQLPQSSSSPVSTPPADNSNEPSQQTTNQQDLLTQDDNSLELAKQKEKEEKKKKEKEEQLRLERERKLAEEQRLAEERRQEEEKRKKQEAIDRANALASAFSGTGSDTQGTGITKGSNQQGNPVGRGSSGGNSWSLEGRSLVGKFVTPTYSKNVEGTITINIRVDKEGNVISATIGTPTDISDHVTLEATKSAALKTKFSTGSKDSFGTITYNFKLM